MSKRVVFLGVLVFCALAFSVFKVEYHVRALRAELAEVNRQIMKNYEDVHVLNAEWVYLTNPSRVKALVENSLAMDYVNYAQLQPISEIPVSGVMLSANEAPAAVKVARVASGN